MTGTRSVQFLYLAANKWEDLVNLSSEDLASKLVEAGLPKTLTRALEGKECHPNFLLPFSVLKSVR